MNHVIAGGLADDRVRRRTAPSVNTKIDACTNTAIEEAAAGGHAGIETRLKKLHGEWDVERALFATAATVALIAFEMARRSRHSGWGTLFRAQMGFLLLHAAVGWCPPLPVLRRLGFRTVKEISKERVSLIERSAARARLGESIGESVG